MKKRPAWNEPLHSIPHRLVTFPDWTGEEYLLTAWDLLPPWEKRRRVWRNAALVLIAEREKAGANAVQDSEVGDGG